MKYKRLIEDQYIGRSRYGGGKLKYTRETIDRVPLRKLLAITPTDIKKRAMNVSIVSRHYETGRMEGFRRTHRKFPTIYNQVRAYTRDRKTGSGKRHKCLIRFYGPPGVNTPVWVWCDCEYFTYTLEVPLKEWNSSSVKNSNGKPATIRNPTNTPYLCKHLYRVAMWAINLKENKAEEKMEQYMKKFE